MKKEKKQQQMEESVFVVLFKCFCCIQKNTKRKRANSKQIRAYFFGFQWMQQKPCKKQQKHFYSGIDHIWKKFWKHLENCLEKTCKKQKFTNMLGTEVPFRLFYNLFQSFHKCFQFFFPNLTLTNVNLL